jgi:hypothetical protein
MKMNRNSFDREFNLMRKLFWVFFAVVAIMIIAIWVTVGMGIYTLVTDPESVGNIAADAIRPIADVIRGE